MTAKRTDNRGQWTIKHADVGPEFQNLVRMAAERQGMTLGAFVVETLRERATAILKGQEGTPQRTPPARLEDVADVLAEAVKKAVADELRREHDASAERQAQALATLHQEQAEALSRLERQARRGRWR
jgi:uncharacterized protein (DUF1778 family)